MQQIFSTNSAHLSANKAVIYAFFTFKWTFYTLFSEIR